MNNYFAVIMAGGIGSRFWPVSRTAYPKQFLDILGTGRTLIQSTYHRFLQIIPKENIFIVTNELYVDLLKEQLPEIPDNCILAEPVMRNTAPCIAYACHKLKNLNPDATIVVAPADHLILDTPTFLKDISHALEVASKHPFLITLGIKPSRPDTGYGYIQFNEKTIEGEFKEVKTFTEKPDLELAKTFIRSGDFLWNAGIFIWSANAILDAFAQLQPEMNEVFLEGSAAFNTPEELKFIASAFVRSPNISIDFAIMEKADNVYVLPSDFGWSDLGTWSSVYELAEKDYLGNAVIPSDNVIIYDSSNCMVNVPDDKLVILQGLRDYIVVESNNTLLICPRNQEQDVKKIVGDVKNKYGADYV
ncbi:mannose-1-phosphate guanylyltransferase [bacterium A37T11]|nr:mannose-1-phosphate guanylyltransferase [bacterium A37T11]